MGRAARRSQERAEAFSVVKGAAELQAFHKEKRRGVQVMIGVRRGRPEPGRGGVGADVDLYRGKQAIDIVYRVPKP
jgi:hypothetical protein